jgi:hypothetical protein
MPFRIEEKILVQENNNIYLKEFLSLRSAKVLFEPRCVQSLYFDNSTLDMFKDSEEGILPRKKIRIRFYPNQNYVFNLETKISSVEGRFKSSKKIDKNKFNHLIKYGIFDTRYGPCKPKIYVRYFRKYLLIKDTRLTYDNNIQYLNSFGKLIGKEVNSILEIKTSISKDIEELLLNFPFQRSRFSKYCNGINMMISNA